MCVIGRVNLHVHVCIVTHMTATAIHTVPVKKNAP